MKWRSTQYQHGPEKFAERPKAREQRKNGSLGLYQPLYSARTWPPIDHVAFLIIVAWGYHSKVKNRLIASQQIIVGRFLKEFTP